MRNIVQVDEDPLFQCGLIERYFQVPRRTHTVLLKKSHSYPILSIVEIVYFSHLVYYQLCTKIWVVENSSRADNQSVDIDKYFIPIKL